MSDVLVAIERHDKGKKVRKEGSIPGTVFGPGVGKSLAVQFEKKDLDRLLSEHTTGSKIMIKIGEKEIPCVIREIQHEPVNRGPVNIDLYATSAGSLVKVKVPLIFKGKENLNRQNLVLNIFINEIEIQGVLKDLPEMVEVNVSSTKGTAVIKMGDIKLSEGIRLLSKGDEVVASISEAAA